MTILAYSEKSPAMDGKSLDITQQKIEELKALFPDVFTEGKIDFDRLKAALGENVFVNGEHYVLSWAGKTEARKEVQKQTTATLIPDREGSIDFDNAQNIFIEGENLEVLRALQKAYFGKVKMIYIDPPYNTGNDSFVYPDDYTERRDEYNKRTGITDDEGYLNKQDLWKKNSKENGQFHSVWLSMMYPRLYLARNLMREDGVIFVSIDDNEQANLKLLMDDVFGEENFISDIIWQKSKKGDSKLIATIHEYVLVYAKNKQSVVEKGNWRIKKEGVEDVLSKYEEFKKEYKSEHSAINAAMSKWYNSLPKDDCKLNHRHYKYSDDRGLYFPDNFAGPDDGRVSRPRYDIIHPITGKPCKKPSTGWRWDENKTRHALAENPPRIHFGPDETTIPCRKSYLKDIDSEPFFSVFYRDGRGATLQVEELVGKGIFSFPKNIDILQDFIKLSNDDDDIILDFFGGSGSTAHAVLQLNEIDNYNRKFILVQMPEPLDEKSEAKKTGYNTIADISNARIKRVIEKLQKEREGKLDFNASGKQHLGFKAYKLAPSNFNIWRNDVEGEAAIIEQLQMFTLSEKEGSADENMLYELILKAGLPLTANVVPIMAGNKTVYSIGDNQLHIFFAKLSDEITATVLALHPQKVICLNSCFETDEDLTNFKLQLKDAGIELTII